jgi:hypothetical protein
MASACSPSALVEKQFASANSSRRGVSSQLASAAVRSSDLVIGNACRGSAAVASAMTADVQA